MPKIYAAGWDDDQISEQKTFTDGRIIVVGNKGTRKKKKRADYLLKYRKDFFDKFGDEARQILNDVLDKYIEFGTKQLSDMNILKVPPVSAHGNPMEISALFGGPAALRNTLGELENILYSN